MSDLASLHGTIQDLPRRVSAWLQKALAKQNREFGVTLRLGQELTEYPSRRA